MKPVEYLVEARDEIEESVAWYRKKDSAVPPRFVDEVDRTIERIVADSNVGHPSERETRSVLLHDFPFRIVFAELSDRIVIIAVAHHCRQPGYWLKRLKHQRN